MATDKKQTGMRFTDTGKRLLERLAKLRGISQTSVVEQLVRDEAARVGIRDVEYISSAGVTAQASPDESGAETTSA